MNEQKKKIGDWVVILEKPYFDQEKYHVYVRLIHEPSGIYLMKDLDSFQAKQYYDNLQTIGMIKGIIAMKEGM